MDALADARQQQGGNTIEPSTLSAPPMFCSFLRVVMSCFRLRHPHKWLRHRRPCHVMVLDVRTRSIWVDRPAAGGDLVSQGREKPNAGSQTSFDRNEGDDARWSNAPA